MNIKSIYISLVFLFLIVQTIPAQEILLTADTNQALIGERINMLVAVMSDSKTQINFPELSDSLSGLEIIEKSKIDTNTQSNAIIYRQIMSVTAFDTGIYVIDSVMLSFKRSALEDTIYAYPLMLAFNTIQLDSTNRFYDIKRPLEIHYSYWFEILMGILGVLAVLTIIYFLIKRRKVSIPFTERPKIIIPPHIVALEKLNAMKTNKAWLNMEIKPYYIELSDVLRTFIQHRFEVSAIESTTDEIMDNVAKLNFGSETDFRLRDFLQMSDLVKFAKVSPIPEEGEKYLDFALSFVEQYKPSELKEENLDNPENPENDA